MLEKTTQEDKQHEKAENSEEKLKPKHKNDGDENVEIDAPLALQDGIAETAHVSAENSGEFGGGFFITGGDHEQEAQEFCCDDDTKINNNDKTDSENGEGRK